MLYRALVALALAVVATLAQGQASSTVYALDPARDIGNIRTLAAQGAATVVSADQVNSGYSHAICVLNQTASSGSPSTTFSIQNKDAASGNYYSLITSAAITTGTTTAIAAGPGVATVANGGSSFPLASKWRVSVTVGGSSTPTLTGTVGCSLQ